MFEQMPTGLIVSYTLFSLFSFYQKTVVAQFQKGYAQGGISFMTFTTIGAMIFAGAFLIYYGITVKWYLPILLFGIALIVHIILFQIEALFGNLATSIAKLGFIGLPVCAYYMVKFLP